MAALLDQIVGNCTWASVEEVVKVFFLLHPIRQEGTFKLPLDIKNLKASLDKTFANWLLFEQLSLLEKYMKYETDPKLIQKCFKNLWNLKMSQASAILDPQLLQQIDTLEAKYAEQASTWDTVALCWIKACLSI